MVFLALLLSCDPSPTVAVDDLTCESCDYAPLPEVEDCGQTSCIVGTTTQRNISPTHPEGPLEVSMTMHEDCGACETESDMDLTYDLTQDCFGWVRTVEPGEGRTPLWESVRDNSAACLTCFTDTEGNGALCFREYTGTLTCDQRSPHGQRASKTTDKVFTTNGCQNDAAGNAWTRLSSVPETGCTLVEDGDFERACAAFLEDCEHAVCGTEEMHNHTEGAGPLDSCHEVLWERADDAGVEACLNPQQGGEGTSQDAE